MEMRSLCHGVTPWIRRHTARAWMHPGLAQCMLVHVLGGLLLCMLLGGPVLGQTEHLPPSTVEPQSGFHADIWHDFLMEVNHSDRTAANRGLKGRDGTPLRNLDETNLGFSDDQFKPIRATAQRLEAELREIDAKIKAVTDADRAAHHLPPELQALHQRSEAMFESEVSNLKQALGPDLAARLDLFIQTNFARMVTAHHPHPDSAPPENRRTGTLEMYRHFLSFVNIQDRAVAEAEQENDGGKGTIRGGNYQQMLGFTDEQFALVRALAQRQEAERKEDFAKVRAILSTDRAAHAPPPELKALNQQREATIEMEVSNLQRVLGPDLAARVDEYARTHVPSDQPGPDHGRNDIKEFQMQTSPKRK